MTTAWWRGLAPVRVEVECSGATHQVLWMDGVVRAPSHPEAEVERTLATLAGERLACIELMDIWARHQADLRVLALTSRGPGDPITLRPPGQFPGGPGAGPPGRAGWPVPSPLAGAATVSRVGLLPTAAHATRRSPQIGARPRPALGGGPFDDPLIRLITTGGQLGDRLAAQVAATWAERLATGDPAAGGKYPALATALYGRASAAVRAWLGDPRIDVAVEMIPAPERPGISRGESGITAALPFAWISEVWTPGLAVLLGRFTLRTLESDDHHLVLETIGSGLGPTSAVTIGF